MLKQTEDNVKVWGLNKWWEKAVYVCGWVFLALFILGFLKGFWSAIPVNAAAPLFTVNGDVSHGFTTT